MYLPGNLSAVIQGEKQANLKLINFKGTRKGNEGKRVYRVGEKGVGRKWEPGQGIRFYTMNVL